MNSASKVDKVRYHSLINRGVNGRVEDEDARTQFTHHNHQVDIRGKENHEINYIPIATAGGFTKNYAGVIIIMHQHVCY